MIVLLAASIAAVAGCESATQFGEPVTGPSVSVRTALDHRSVGRTLTVEGSIHEVCRDEGCWFILADDSSEITVRYVADNGLGIPVISKGRARVRAVVRDTVIGKNRVPELRAVGVQLLGE
jgi:hypothetical protein